MRDKPILFSGPMVRALLEGRKTQTRRLIKPQPVPATEVKGGVVYGPLYQNDWIWPNSVGYTVSNRPGGPVGIEKSFPIQVGDWLWVREAWRQAWPATDYSPGIVYRADAARSLGMDEYSDRHHWKPSIHLAKKHSRLTLQVTEVRAMRLQDISEEDAKAEGAHPEFEMELATFVRGAGTPESTYYLGYKHLWDRINGDGAWAANPWVAAYTFRVHRKNVNDITKEDADDGR